MHAMEILRQTLTRSGCVLHKRRLHGLLQAVQAALAARSHTLSNLARALTGHTSVRHRVKCMDRLLGNTALQRECSSIYRALAAQMLSGCQQPVILIDWTDLKADRSVQMIRASLALHGRSLCLLEQVYAGAEAATPEAHRRFLQQLRAIVGQQVRPILITDAGFRAPWFAAVQQLGWHWLGRIRGRDLMRPAGDEQARWRSCRQVWATASTTAVDLGAYECVRSRPHVCRLVLIKHAPKGRHKRTVHGAVARSKHSCKNARAQTEPWLLACSCSLQDLSAAAIVALYAQRMQIEQEFRDSKNARLGLGIEHSGTRSPERLAVLALIATLAQWVLHLLGQWAMQQGQQRHWQLTNRRVRPELSVHRLGWLIAHVLDPPIEQLREVIGRWTKPNMVLRI